MNKIDFLIKTLTEFKEELEKADTQEAPEKVNLNNPYNEQDDEKKKKKELEKASKTTQGSSVVGVPAEHVKAIKIKNISSHE
jgi:hypothetical protein